MIMMRAGWKKLVVIIILPGHDPAAADHSCHNNDDSTGSQAEEGPESRYVFSAQVWAWLVSMVRLQITMRMIPP